MPRQPQVRVRDKETGLEYLVSEARFKRTPELWERIGSAKPKTSVAAAAANKAAMATEEKAASGQSADQDQEES